LPSGSDEVVVGRTRGSDTEARVDCWCLISEAQEFQR
jgi:hypothetical protein